MVFKISQNQCMFYFSQQIVGNGIGIFSISPQTNFLNSIPQVLAINYEIQNNTFEDSNLYKEQTQDSFMKLEETNEQKLLLSSYLSEQEKNCGPNILEMACYYDSKMFEGQETKQLNILTKKHRNLKKQFFKLQMSLKKQSEISANRRSSNQKLNRIKMNSIKMKLRHISNKLALC